MFQGLDYVPLLHARLAEIRAFEALAEQTKRRMFPVVRLRPWFNAATIDRAIEVVEAAIGDGASCRSVKSVSETAMTLAAMPAAHFERWR